MVPFTLTMVEGELKVRAAEEPLPLEQPTTITGQHDTGDDGTGAVTGADLATPPISFETVASGLTVYIDAFFSSVAPGSGTGSIDSDGNVSLRTDLKVDLDLRLGSPTATPLRCTTSPVGLAVESVAPYDPETQTVTVRDAEFSIPPVEATTACNAAVAGAVSEQLAGAGNSLQLTLAGPLALPPAPGCPSVTTLTAVTPATSFQGQSVAISAQVVADPASTGTEECQDAGGAVPSGVVELRADGELVGTAELDDSGMASGSFSTLPLGEVAVTARYRGDAAYGASSSGSVAHTTYARPSLVADLPQTLVIGADPVEFDVTVSNTGLGADLANARIDVTMRYANNGLPLPPGRVALARLDGPVWTPITLNYNYGSVQPATGAPLAAGDHEVVRLRISSPTGTPITRVQAVFEAQLVDPVSGLPAPLPDPATDVLDSTILTTSLVTEARSEVTLTPEYVLAHTVRQGLTVAGAASMAGLPGAAAPSGRFRVLLDGQPIGVRYLNAGNDVENALTRTVSSGAVAFLFEVPTDARLGENEVTVIYLGDDAYEPASASLGTITVLPPRGGDLYECRSSILIFPYRFNAYVTAAGSLPTTAVAGSTVGIPRLDVRLDADRGYTIANLTGHFGPTTPVVPPDQDGFQVIDFQLGGGSGTATAVTTANNEFMFDDTRPIDPAPDVIIGFEGESASIPISGPPGTAVPVTLDAITLRARIQGGFGTVDVTCTPKDEAVSLGDVTVAGTTLSVDAPSPARERDAVTLRARVAPSGVAGLVEFLDGDRTIGSTPVATDGTASLTTRALPVGAHQLTAVFRGGWLALPSAPVALEVRPELECPTFTQDGHGAVVRLVYLELLGRCPDQAGFDYWTGRLGSGTSPEVFARTIARTPEAVGRVVDDGYRTMLGRPADAAGRAFWTGRLLAHGRYDTLLADLGASDEFWSKAGSTNAGFVDRVYGQLLGRSPDQAGQDFWVGRLDAGTSRRALIVSLAILDEPLGVLVADSYDEILSRTPTSGERSDGIAFLRRTGDRSGLYAQLIGRPEFTTRAQTFPNPED